MSLSELFGTSAFTAEPFPVSWSMCGSLKAEHTASNSTDVFRPFPPPVEHLWFVAAHSAERFPESHPVGPWLDNYAK